MQRQFQYELHSVYGTVSAQLDIDGSIPQVIVTADRRVDDLMQLRMTPRQARRLAKQLNHFARLIDPPKPRHTKAR
jgi:hypothetical protein